MKKRYRSVPSAKGSRLGLEQLEPRLVLAGDAVEVSHAWFGDAVAVAPLTTEQANLQDDASRWIVQLSDTALQSVANVAEAASLLANLSLSGARGLGLPGQLAVDAVGSYADIYTRLAASGLIASFQIDAGIDGALIANDPRFALNQYPLLNSAAETLDRDIDADLAWNITTGSADVVVAVIDSGIDYTHPDLADNIWASPGAILGPDDVTPITNGWDFANDDADPLDDHGHGTHVAGTVGAVGNNELGVAGVNWDVSLLPIKLLDANNTGSVEDAIAAINYTTLLRTQYDVNVRVINASWGGVGVNNEMLADAIDAAGAAGILFVSAAGNGDAFGRGQDLTEAPFYPASFDLQNMLTVGATDRNDLPTRFTNFGQDVDLSAPGQSVWSTDLLVDSGLQVYSPRSGTSMASPHVAGVAALAWSVAPDATVNEVRQALLDGGETIAELQGQSASGKRLNAFGTLKAVPPQAEVTTADDVTSVGGTSYQFAVTLAKPSGDNLLASTVGDGDFFVRRADGSGTALTATLVSPAPGGNLATFSNLTYAITPPGGTWDTVDVGTYEIVLAANQIEDINGGVSIQKVVGTFEVDLSSVGVFRPTVFYDAVDAEINGVADDGTGAVTLRAAIQEANAFGSPATILLAPGTYTLSLAGVGEDAAAAGDLDITGNVTIASDGTGEVIIDAAGIDRALDVQVGATLVLEGVTLTGGVANASDGGGIRNFGTATVTRTTVDANQSIGSNTILDPSFATAGANVTDLAGENDKTYAIAAHQGGYIVAGSSRAGGGLADQIVTRYHANGQVDSSFGSSGTTILDTTGDLFEQANDIAVQADGKIVVVGQSYGTTVDFVVTRLNADGSLDTTFDGDGIKLIDWGGVYDLANAAAIQADGKIVVGGNVHASNAFSSHSDFGIVRLNSDGSVDTTFGASGFVQTDFGTTFSDTLNDIEIDASGAILAIGQALVDTGSGFKNDVALARYSSSGALDNTFGSGGLVTTAISATTGPDEAVASVLQADGKILVAASTTTTDADFGLVRYNTDGTLDSGFGTAGVVVTDIGDSDNSPADLALQGDGKIVVLGTAGNFDAANVALVRYEADGSLDPSFDEDGIAESDLGLYDTPTSIIVDAEDRSIVAGHTGESPNTNLLLARYDIQSGASARINFFFPSPTSKCMPVPVMVAIRTQKIGQAFVPATPYHSARGLARSSPSDC